jgi:pimeloyl-ACP methyl ester carboxylesterase
MPVLNVPGAALWYQDAGSGASDGAPVVFLHPASGSSDSWRFQQQPFKTAGYRCITYDLRGWGRSTSEGDPGCMSDDLAALVDALHLDRFSLVGAAYGGFGALDYAMRFPERLRALVLSGTQGGIADPQYASVRERVVAPPVRALPLEFRELGACYRTRDPAGVQQWLEITRAEGHARQRMHTQIALRMLAQLHVPTLLIAGGSDLLAPPELMRQFAAHLPDHEFVTVCESGHCVHWEEPEQWNRLVLDFLSRR